MSWFGLRKLVRACLKFPSVFFGLLFVATFMLTMLLDLFVIPLPLGPEWWAYQRLKAFAFMFFYVVSSLLASVFFWVRLQPEFSADQGGSTTRQCCSQCKQNSSSNHG